MMRRLLTLTTVLLLAAMTFAAGPDIGLKSAADLLNAGHADEAIVLLGSRIKAQPRDAEAYNLLARVYYATGRWDEAAGQLEAARTLAPPRL